jgi:hypothetical protein
MFMFIFMFNKIISFENKIRIHQNRTIFFIYFLFYMKTLIPYFLKYIEHICDAYSYTKRIILKTQIISANKIISTHIQNQTHKIIQNKKKNSIFNNMLRLFKNSFKVQNLPSKVVRIAWEMLEDDWTRGGNSNTCKSYVGEGQLLLGCCLKHQQG